jgi:carbon-monoxide dehydrogenase large subunit
MKPQIKVTPRFAGARVKRIEDPHLLVGRGAFVDDLTPSGCWHVVVVRSPHAHARIRRIRSTSKSVVTARDLGRSVYVPGEAEEKEFARHPVLARDLVHYVGQPVAAVYAQTLARACDIAAGVQVDYDPLPPVVDPEAAQARTSVILHKKLRSNIVHRERWTRGKVAQAFRDAAVTMSERIVHQRLVAVSLEGRAVLAVPPQRSEQTLTVWSSTQMPHGLRDALKARVKRGVGVRVIAPDVGGGFGAKGSIYAEELLVPLLALKLGRPLKWVESRREHMMTICHGRSQFADVALAASADGRILGLRLHVVADVGAYLMAATAFIPPLTLEMSTGPYDIRSAEASLVEVYTNKVPTGPYRGAGRPEAAFYLERALDILARDMGLDPAEIRRRNFIPADSFPYRALSGSLYDSGNYVRALDRALESSGYARWRQQQSQGRAEGRYIGIGLSSYVETCTYGADASRVVVDGGGKVTVYSGTSPHGQGGATGFAQIVADALGVDVAQITVITGDTAAVPNGEGTAGSRTLVVGGSAVFRAAQVVRQKILDRAAKRLEASVADLVLTGGRVHVAGVPGRGLTLAELVGSTPLSGSGRYTVQGGTYPFGTHVAIVEVDPETGAVQFLAYVAVDDCGVVINPLLVEGQVHGGVAQAVGQALFEDAYYDEAGQLVSGSLADYAIPHANQVPTIRTLRTETPSPRNPLGAKGVGEAGTIGATPAVVNAVLDALAPLRVRHLDMPLAPAKIWAAIRT